MSRPVVLSIADLGLFFGPPHATIAAHPRSSTPRAMG